MFTYFPPIHNPQTWLLAWKITNGHPKNTTINPLDVKGNVSSCVTAQTERLERENDLCIFFFPKESHNEYNLNIKAVLRFAQLSLEEKAKSSRMTLTLFNIK